MVFNVYAFRSATVIKDSRDSIDVLIVWVIQFTPISDHPLDLVQIATSFIWRKSRVV